MFDPATSSFLRHNIFKPDEESDSFAEKMVKFVLRPYIFYYAYSGVHLQGQVLRQDPKVSCWFERSELRAKYHGMDINERAPCAEFQSDKQ